MIVMCAVSACFADTNQVQSNSVVNNNTFSLYEATSIVPYDINMTCLGGFVRTASNKAVANITIRCLRDMKSITLVTTLQKYSSSAEKYVNTSNEPVITSEYNSSILTQRAAFNVNSTGTYRVKMVVTGKASGETQSHTFYETMK